MVKLQIININNETYTLRSVETEQTYKFNLVFYKLETLPQVNDFLSFHNELLDKNYKEYANSYQFGPLNEVYGRQVISSKDVDIIELNLTGKKLYLKRFFG